MGYAIGGDGIQEFLIDVPAECGIILALDGNHGLKGFERLDGTLEADRSRCNFVFRGCLGHDRADQVVRQDMRPNLLPYKFRCFAPSKSS